MTDLRLPVIQVACALLMAGEDLEKHTDVKNILVEMGTYFQVQASFTARIVVVICHQKSLESEVNL